MIGPADLGNIDKELFKNCSQIGMILNFLIFISATIFTLH